MAALTEKPDLRAVEDAARRLWAAERLPPATGPVGPPEGPVVHQFEGSFAPQEGGTLAVQRAVAADVDARAMLLVGRRALGILRKEEGGPSTPTPRLEPLLAALGVWVGGSDGRNWDERPRRAELQTLVGRLAHLGVIAVRDVSLRICPACAMARSPERIVYQEEVAETLLVRFPFPYGDGFASALVWVDAPWRLLGTSALMVHPDLPYVIARYRRRGSEEIVFTSKASLDRIRDWLPGADLEVLEEHPGRHWGGTTYVHPLRHEFPMGGSLEPPAGTIVPVADVSNSGTGVVPLVPGHGGTDTQIADRLSVPGWPLITPKGRFDILFVHKYAGLELESGSEFVDRDLAEGEAIFARLRVRRGVPHCSRCGTALIWAPGRAWCLEPSRLPEEKVARYRFLLPRVRPIEKLEAVPWPVSEPQQSDEPMAITLLECSQCDLLEAVGKGAERCSCGGRRRPVRRRLLPAFDAAASAWASVDPVVSADSVRIYVNERRRAPALVHHIAAMSGVAGTPGEVHLTVLPTVPEANVAGLIAIHGADAVRAALVRAQNSEGATGTFEERCVQEARRFGAFWNAAREFLATLDGSSLSAYAQPIGGSTAALEAEDRAFLARFERLRVQCLVEYDRSAPAAVHRRLFHFLENDLVTYRDWVAPRLALDGSPPSKQAAQHTLVHVLSLSVTLLGPIAPHLAEVVHRSLRRGRASLFQEAPIGVDRALLDENRAKAWDRWFSVIRAVERWRRAEGVPSATVLPALALVVDSDPAGGDFRADAPTIERLARVRKVEVGSPGSPWDGRRRELRPKEAEIQRVYSSRAAQIFHLLRRMPERKATELGATQGFTMIVNGQPTLIMPSMIEWVEVLPPHFIPAGWSGGELYVELPAGKAPAVSPPPPLSRDAFRLAARIARRIRTIPSEAPRAVTVVAPPALAEELSASSESVARYLGVREFRVVTSDAEVPRHDRVFGRTRGGAAWSFHVAGGPASVRRVKHRRPGVPSARVRPAFAPGELAPTVTDFADAGLIARETAVRALGEELDGILGAPLLGPAKVGAAWDSGLRSVDAFRAAPWATLAAVPGFGGLLASALVTSFGGVVPPPPPRVPRAPGPSLRLPPEPPSIQSIEETGPGTPPSTIAPPADGGSSVLPEAPAREVARTSPSPLPPDSLSPPPPISDPETTPPEVEPPAAPEEPSPTGELRVKAPSDPSPSTTPLDVTTTEIVDSSVISLPDAPPLASEPQNQSPEGSRATMGTASPVVPTADPTLADEEPIPLVRDLPVSEEFIPEALPAPAAPPTPVDAVGPAERPGALTAVAVSPTRPMADEPPATVPAPREGSVELLEDRGSGDRQASPAPGPPPVVEPNPPEPGPVVDVPSAPVPERSELPPTEPIAPTGETPLPPPVPTPSIEVPSPASLETSPSEVAGSEPGGPLEAESNVAPHTPAEFPLAPKESDAVILPAPTEEANAVPPTPEERAFPSASAAVAVPEPSAVAPPAPSAGGIELAVGPSYLPSLERFLEATAAGHQGICVVRDSPERVRAYIGSRPVEIRWLSNIGRGLTLKPTDLDGFSAFLARAVTSGHVTAFFIEGAEYLVRLHGLDKFVERMAEFDRLAREHSARVWVPLNPKLLSTPELVRFVAAFSGASPAV